MEWSGLSARLEAEARQDAGQRSKEANTRSWIKPRGGEVVTRLALEREEATLVDR